MAARHQSPSTTFRIQGPYCPPQLMKRFFSRFILKVSLGCRGLVPRSPEIFIHEVAWHHLFDICNSDVSIEANYESYLFTFSGLFNNATRWS